MPCRLNFKSAGYLFLLLGCVSFSNAAWAGFQWVAPTDPLPATNDTLIVPSPAPLSPSGLQATSPEVISPLVIQGSTSSNVESPTYNGPPVELRPSQPALPVTAPAPTLSETSSPAQPEEIVHGFAKSVPLAVALRQILPLGYTFSIDQGVDMGTTVSFEGGRPWRDTLREMLVPSGLVMREKGQVVSIGYKTESTLSASAAPAQPAPKMQMAAASGSQVSVFPQAIAASAVSVPAPPGSGPMNGDWTAEHGDTLHKVLDDWCHRAHVEFDWLAEYDYPIEATASFPGTFEDAVRGLLAGFEGAHPQPVAELHSNPHAGQMVLIVQTRGNSSTD